MDKNSILLYNNIILKVKVMLTTHFLDGACFNNNKKKIIKGFKFQMRNFQTICSFLGLQVQHQEE